MRQHASVSILSAALFVGAAQAAMPLTGFYKTIDDKTGNAKSIVRLYECPEPDDLYDNDHDRDMDLCGRIVALYDAAGGNIAETITAPARVAYKVAGAPKLAGLDIVWGMEWDDDDMEYDDGKILDPESGSVYSSVIWRDKSDPSVLRVRGKIGPFGRTQAWRAVSAAELPAELQGLDTTGWRAVVRQ